MFRYTTLRTLLTFLILLLFPFWSFANNKIEENACYGNYKLSRLVREITDAKVEKSNRKDSGIGEAFTFGYAEADVDGNGSLLYSNQVMKFDYYASSVGASLGGTKLVNAVRLYGNSSRLDEKYMEIYLSSEGLDGSWYKAETFCIEKDESGLKVIFAEPVEAGYVKIHSTWDERDEDYRPVDRSETGGKPYDLLEVFVIQQGRRNEWSYDARGNRVVSTIDNSSLVIEYYNSSDLLRKYGEWYFNYDANGNMIARGRNGIEKTSMASDALFEGYDFSSDKGELWTYEYDLSNRLVKVNYSGSGKNGLKEKCKYTYDYRGLCIAKTSGNEIEYNEYTADGKLIYTEKKGYIADYVYSGTSIFAEIRIQDEKKEIFYHHTDHLGTTEAITDESGTIVWKASYEAFGAVLCENGTKVFEASFTGKFFDKDIGLYYFNARWYDAEIGRFVTQDPARDGLNWYAYCSNNPLKFVDNDGCIADYFWDAASLAAGAVSFGYNIHHGNTKEAIFDAIGMVADAAALAIPLVPGGIGIARKGLVATKIVADTVGGVDAVVSGGQSVVEGIQNGNFLEAGFGAFQAITGAGQTGMAVKKGVKAAKANKRLNQMIKSNKAYNVSPESWFMEYNTLGRKGTFITDDKALKDILGDFELGSQKLDKDTISRLEKSLGLNKGSLSKSGFRITEINNITDKNPRIPTQDMGNQFFRFGEGLPGGGPELVIDPIPTGGK